MTTELWTAIGIIVLLALLILWWPYARNSNIQAKSDSSRQDANKESYLSSLEKIDTQLEEGRIDQSQYDELKAELGRKLIQESAQTTELQVKSHSIMLPLILSGLMISGSVYMYLKIGSSQQIEQAMTQNEQSKSQQQKFLQALKVLEDKVAENPDNSEMLFNLAHFYISAQQFDKAVAAFNKLIEMVGEHAEFIGPQAQALYYKNDQKMNDEIQALIDRALALDPNDVSTLVLQGMDNFVNGNYGPAIVLWQRVINNGRPGTDVEALTNAINNAKQRLEMTGQPMPEIEEVTISNSGVDVEVSISDALVGKFTPEQTIFIYAIASEGPRMPLAAVKLTAGDLPLSIRLDDTRAMTPAGKISQHKQVRLFAVISQTGSPGIKSGDLHGMIERADVDNKKPYSLVIDKVAE
ncbi:MAG: c-type cytochrome biogenesis protein CcmI [Psychrobium sp.]